MNILSDQTARGDYRVVGVSRGHSSSLEPKGDEGLNGASCESQEVNESGD